MSNHLAAAAVTATLRKTLQAALDDAVPGINNARVTTLRPSDPGADLPTPGVNIFLYRVSPSASLRNAELPVRGANGNLVNRPSSPVELHYLLSFHGDEGKLEPQILLGIVTRALHAQPVLTHAMISAMLADATFAFLAGTDLQDAPELVRLSTVPLSLEELSKLWSVVFQTPYVLSQVYVASVVVIDAVGAAGPALPVARTALVVNAGVPVAAAPLEVAPSITAAFAAGSVTVGFATPVGPRQRVALILNQLGASRAFAFDAPARSSPAPVASIAVPIAGVPPGDYLVRVRVDGAESALAADPATGRFSSPRVTIP